MYLVGFELLRLVEEAPSALELRLSLCVLSASVLDAPLDLLQELLLLRRCGGLRFYGCRHT
jgi:hypothetical protein